MEQKENPPDFGTWVVADETKFPPGFFDIGGFTFLQVYNTKKVFVDFIQKVDDTKGLFAAFQNYCIKQERLVDSSYKILNTFPKRI